MDAGNRRREDSGLIDLDALMRQANESAGVEESGERPIVRPEKRSEPPPAPIVDSTPALVTAIPAAPRLPDPKPSTGLRSRRIAAAGAALGLVCAGVYAYSRAHPPPAPAAVVVVTPREPAAAVPRPLETSKQADESPAANANDLPPVTASAPTSSPSPSVAKHAAPAKQVDAVVTTTEAIPETPQSANDLGRAMHDAVGEGATRVAKTDGTPANDARTLRPSPGAVIGALNAVLPSARACLGPDDAIRVGTVTFRSDGSVAKVELAGKRESDECIRGAVSRAHVEPFADDSFATRITVRP